VTEKQTPNVNEVLNQIAEIIRGAQDGPRDTGSSTPTQTTQPASKPVDPSALDPEVVAALRDLVATEFAYNQLIPPLTPRVLADIDDTVATFPDFVKSASEKPYFRALFRAAVDMAMSQMSQSSNEDGRSLGEDRELQVAAQTVVSDLTYVDEEREERVLPLFAAAAAGIAIGKAIHACMN
jgi:hypothetical protein